MSAENNNAGQDKGPNEKTSFKDDTSGSTTYTVVDELDQEDLQPNREGTLSAKTLIELSICILTFIGRGLCLNSVGPTLIDLRQLTQTGVETSAYIFVAQSIGFFIGSIAAKPMLEKFNKELLMCMVLVLQALSTILIPAFPNIILMCLAFCGQGFAIGVAGIGVCTMCLVLGGNKRNGQFLQSVYLGVSIGSIIGPFVAKPFLSVENHQVTAGLIKSNDTTTQIGATTPTVLEAISMPWNISGSNSTGWQYSTSVQSITTTTEVITTPYKSILQNYTVTHVFYVYLIIAIILCIPATGFLILFLTNKQKNGTCFKTEKSHDNLNWRNLSAHWLTAVILLFLSCFIYFGIQDSYSNLLTTFCVRSALKLEKVKGVYITSLFWASVCFGRLNGIWIARFLSPFKMLLIDASLGTAFALMLLIWGEKSEAILWICSAMLGISFASINGATVAWAAKHIGGNGYILSVIMIGRCLGLMSIPSGLAGLFKVVGAISLLYAVFMASVSILLIYIILQTMTKYCGQEGKIVGKNYAELEEEMDVITDSNHDK